MKNKFPYKGNIVTVTKDMCDMNGHMNVSYYSKVFDEGGFCDNPLFESNFSQIIDVETNFSQIMVFVQLF